MWRADVPLCHDRGLCSVFGPVRFGVVVAYFLGAIATAAIVAAIISHGSRTHRCLLTASAASLLIARSSLLDASTVLAAISSGDESDPRDGYLAVSSAIDFPIFSRLEAELRQRHGRASLSDVRTRLPDSLALRLARRYDAVLIPVDGARGRFWFATPDPTREPPVHYGAHWYRSTLLNSPHRLGGQTFLEAALSRLAPGGVCPDSRSWVVLNAGAHLGRWPALAASHGCRAISVEVMPWILPFLHVTREVNGWQDLWTPVDGALGDTDGAVLNISSSGGQGVSGLRHGSAETTYDLQVRSHTFDTLAARFAPNASIALAVIDVEGFENEALLGMRRLISSGTLKWARIEVWSHIHGAVRKSYPGLTLLVAHGYRLCGADGRELTLGWKRRGAENAGGGSASRRPERAVYKAMRKMCKTRYRDETKPDKIVHCQDDVEAFHPSVFDRCGGRHGGFM